MTNLFETLLGLGYAVARSHALAGKVDHLHAVWASSPATAAWAIRQLTGIPYSMAGHAYDLFEDGGDGLLDIKIPQASFIRTSTKAGRARWIRHGAQENQVHLVRRGILDLPEIPSNKLPVPNFRLLAVGRLVEKMGYPTLLEILAELKRAGLPFAATIIGSGPLRMALGEQSVRLGLEGLVRFEGALPFEAVVEHYRQADVFLFTGQVSRSGDRAGFPNAIGEAMAFGVPVCARCVGAVNEGIQHGQTGLLFTDPAEAAAQICDLLASPDDFARIRLAARRWVEKEFDAGKNMQQFANLLLGQSRGIS